MKLDIQDSKDRLDVLEGTTITSINEQITAINTSVTELKEMDAALDGYVKSLEITAEDLQKQIEAANAEIAKVESELCAEISALEQSLLNELNTAKEAIEAELAAINATLTELNAADVALDKKIEDLQTYVDSQLASTTNWANATFSTLTQYAETQTEIASIKSNIEMINASLVALETRLNGKITDDIKAAINALRSELSADYVSKIENAVTAVTDAYTSAISSAKEELKAAYMTAISTAITESEISIKSWVNEQLTQGYYDISTLEGILSALSVRLDEADSDLQGQINEQKIALEAAKTELSNASKTAINTAISENNGVITAAIAEAVQNLEDKIQARLTVIDTHISNIQKQLSNISKDIASIYEQIANISSSISNLQDVDKALDEVIDALETELASLQDEFESLKSVDEPTKKQLEKEIADIKTLIAALQAKDLDLQNSINTLQAYINSELQNTTDWANATFATLEQYADIQTELSAIKTLINQTKAELTDQYTTAIEVAISNSETSIKSWVNSLLAQGYYDIAVIDGKVSALELLINEGDGKLQDQIYEQKEALKQAKTDLTNEYKQYINQAIEAGGIIDQAIAAQVKAAEDNLQAQIEAINSEIDSLKDRLGKLEEDFVNRIQSLKYIPEYSDRMVRMTGPDRLVVLDFQISPSSQAKKIVAAWEKDKSVLSGSLRVLKNPSTRSIDPSIALTIKSAYATDDGVLSVGLSAKDIIGIDENFLAGIKNGVLNIRISDGNSDLFSDLIDVSCVDLSVFEDLSPSKDGKYQTANCYIVSEPGLYKFKAYRGNSNDLAGSESELDLPEGIPVSASVLWESFGTATYILSEELIDYVRYFDEYIVFRKANNTKTGNALIAANNKDDMPLWSWHIWITDKPKEQVYYNNAGIMMDRNLGATSNTPGDIAACGLLYQWGRKDPFIQSLSPSSILSTIIWPSSVTSTYEKGTYGYATTHPTTFIKTNTINSDWYYVNLATVTRWSPSKQNKSIFDPCPSGWRVPDGGANGVWAKALGSSSGFNASSLYDSVNLGINFSGRFGEDSNIWYPAARYIADDGKTNISSYAPGRYWSATEDGYSCYALTFDGGNYGYAYVSGSEWLSQAFSIRCQKE